MGRADIQLPEELNGTTVEVNFPASVTAIYGQCKAPPDPDEQKPEMINLGCTVLVQIPSPTVTAPPGIDITQIGEAFLQLLGLSREEAAEFSQQVDWSSTLIIPIPHSGDISYKEVLVDGVTGTLIQNESTYYPDDPDVDQERYALCSDWHWQRRGSYGDCWFTSVILWGFSHTLTCPLPPALAT